MIIAPLESPQWASDDAQNLRIFLESSTGQKALACVAYQIPELLDGGDVNATLVMSGRVKGFSEAIFAFMMLTKEQPLNAPLPEMYPSIDDDAKWDHLAER